MEGWRKWNEMENDCLVCIFQKLDLKDLALSIPFACKTWYVASLSPLCWRVLDFRQLDFAPASGFGKQFAVRYPLPRLSFSAFMKFAVRRSRGSAVELRFPPFFEVSKEELVYASTECPRLKVLGMDSIRLEAEAHFPATIGKWKELEHLEMETGPSLVSELAAEINRNCNEFKRLTMAGAINTDDALAIAKYLPKLKNLNLSRSYLPKHDLLLIMDSCRELETLSVKYCVGFGADDEEVVRRACGIKFESEGSKLMEDFCYGIEGLAEYCVLLPVMVEN